MMKPLVGNWVVVSVLAVTLAGCGSDVGEDASRESSEELRQASCTARLEYWSVDDVAGAKNATCWSSTSHPGAMTCVGPWREISLRKGQTLTMKAGSPANDISSLGVLDYWMVGVSRSASLSDYVGVEAQAGHSGRYVYTATEDVKLRVSTHYGFREAPRRRPDVPASSLRVIALVTC